MDSRDTIGTESRTALLDKLRLLTHVPSIQDVGDSLLISSGSRPTAETLRGYEVDRPQGDRGVRSISVQRGSISHEFAVRSLEMEVLPATIMRVVRERMWAGLRRRTRDADWVSWEIAATADSMCATQSPALLSYDPHSVRRLHALLKSNPYGQEAPVGEFREEDCRPRGGPTLATDPRRISIELDRLAEVMGGFGHHVPLDGALIAHALFLAIHPFKDGSGRIARMILSEHLSALGLGVLVLDPTQAAQYFTALDEARRGELDTLRSLVIANCRQPLGE